MIRALTQWDESPGLSDLAQTAAGRCIVWFLASVLLFWHSERGPLSAGGTTLVIIAIGALPLVSAFPARKRWFLSIASVLAIFEFFLQRQLPELQLGEPRTWFPQGPDWRDIALLVTLALLGLYGFYRLLARFTELPRVVRRYPVIALHGALWLALLCVPVFRAPSVVLEVLPVIAWRLSYLVQFAARGHLAGSGFAAHLFYLWPVYGPNGVPTPLGKGLEYLSRHEAVERGEFARSQLAGLKLLTLAFVWEVLLRAMDIHVYGQSPGPTWSWLGTASIGLPRLHEIMDRDLTDAPTVVAGLYLELVRMSLLIAIYGHIIVGSMRLLGFRVFRHTYRPLLSTSIVDFWNRWSYYYKEVLTEFFFFPVFLRSSWAGPRLRLFLAVFAAAVVGNMYFVILWEVDLLFSGNVHTMWTRWGSRTVYCILLGLGIWVSILRQQRSRKQPFASRKTAWGIIPSAFLVCSFYAIAHVWNVGDSALGPVDRLLWLLRVTGL